MRTVQATAPLAAATGRRAVWDELIDGLPVGVVLQDEHGSVLAGNRLAADLLAMRHDELLSSRKPPDWQVCDDSGAPLPTCVELATQVLRTGAPLTIPVVVTRGDTARVQVWAEYHPVTLRGQPRLLVLLQPVHTDAPHSKGLLDPLTGLPGRVLLFDRLDQALIRARTHGTLTSLVLLDVHRLAAVNAEHGFHRGDELLMMLAGRLREGLRADYTVARYGGDEFAVIAEHPSGTGEPVAERVRDLASRPVRIAGTRVRPSVRVCWVTSDGDAPVHTVVSHVEERLRR